MPRSYLDDPVPVAALATPPGRSALALLRTTGQGAIGLAATCFSGSSPLTAVPARSCRVGTLVDPATGEPIDEVVATVFRGPASPTGEDMVEFSCHGSPAVTARALAVLEAAGFAPALPGEFSFRAFANGKADLTRAEAVDELSRARGERARAEALRRLEGGLQRRLAAARSALVELLSEAEVRLDYAEEDGAPGSGLDPAELRSLRDGLAGLAASYATGRLRSEGARLAIAGRPNAGKSSLFNLLLREERSIVSPEPGTTRDWIEAGIELAGVPLRLLDTAGLREGAGSVEAAGVERSRGILAEAELVVWIADGLSTGEGAEAPPERKDAVKLWNKVDDPRAAVPPAGWIPFSAREGRGLPALHAALEERLRAIPGGSGEDEIVVASGRQKGLLDRAVAALDGAAAALGAGAGLDAAAVELRDAADALGEATGEIGSPEVLEAIFSRFCLGK